MRTLRVNYRSEAAQDLADIHRYIAGQGAQRTATAYVKRIRDRCKRIGMAPFSGVSREDLEPGLRTIGFERRAVIAYRVLEDRVQITNVFYGGRDVEALYRDRREKD